MIREAATKTDVFRSRPDRPKEKAIRVVTVDDSALIRLTLNRYLNQSSDIEVVGQASNGSEMLSLVDELSPDVVILDVEMPVMNGLEGLKRLMDSHPLPVIMLSNLTWSGAEVTLHALELGAADFVIKPRQGVTMAETVDLLAQKIRGVVSSRAQFRSPDPEERPSAPLQTSGAATERRLEPLQPSDMLLAIASSTGGPSALTAFLSALTPGLPIGGVIVQHMPTGFTTILGQRLNRIGGYRVVEASDGSRLMRGQFLIAPGGYHLTFDSLGVGALNQDPPVNGVRPAADVTFRSLARSFGFQTTVVVLTGMGSDGLAGAKEIHRHGGKVLAQDENSAVVFGMPRQIVESRLADFVAPPHLLGRYLAERAAE